MVEQGNLGSSRALGEVHSTQVAEYAAFDALPRPIREEIANAAYDYSAEQIFAAYQEYMRCDFMFERPSVFEFLRGMRENFQMDLARESITKLERGQYILRRRAKPKVRKMRYE